MKPNVASKKYRSPRYSTKSRKLRLSTKRRNPDPKKCEPENDEIPENYVNIIEKDSGNSETDSLTAEGPVLVSAQSLNLPHIIRYSSHGHDDLPLSRQLAKDGETKRRIKCESILSETESLNMSLYPEIALNSPAPLFECSPEPSGSTSVPSELDPLSGVPLGGKAIEDLARTVAQLQSRLLHMGAVIHDHALQINELRQGRDSSHERIFTLEKVMNSILVNRKRQREHPFNPNLTQVLSPE